MNIKVALIVSTYNWPEALELCLQGILRQTRLPDEVIIADDGSGPETQKIVKKYSGSGLFELKHIWQEDKGFRLSEIRNRAVKACESDYLIFIDGDIILHPRFVTDHLRFARSGSFITGSRVLMSQLLTSRILKGVPFRYSFFSGGFQNRFNAVRILFLTQWFKGSEKKYLNVRGCNISCWKSDLLLIDGFDMAFTGWGREDSDLVLRLLNAGKKRIRIKFAAIQYHLYHLQRSRESLDINEKILHESFLEKRTTALKGISSLKKTT